MKGEWAWVPEPPLLCLLLSPYLAQGPVPSGVAVPGTASWSVVAKQPQPVRHSKAGWVWLPFLASGRAVVLKTYEGSRTPTLSPVMLRTVWLPPSWMVSPLLGWGEPRCEAPVLEYRVGAGGVPYRCLCETRAGQTGTIEGSKHSLGRAHPTRTGSRETNCSQGGCHHLKGSPPSWLGKEETPSSQIPLPEAQEGGAKGQQPSPVSRELEGLRGAGSPRADWQPAALRTPPEVPRTEVGCSAMEVMVLALQCWFGWDWL